MNEHLQKKIDDTLNLIEQIRPVSPKPFFYTRVKSKLESEVTRMIKPIPVSLKVICSIVVLINLAFFASSLSQTESKTRSQQLASFYHLNSVSNY